MYVLARLLFVTYCMCMQAMARVWRDGQRRHTYVYRLLATGSIEEKIFQRQVNKQGLTGAVVDAKTGGERHQMPAFDAEQLRRLFSLDEQTSCSTHDLLDCRCTVDQCRLRSESASRESVRDCQLVVNGAALQSCVRSSFVLIPSPFISFCNIVGELTTELDN